MSGRFLPHFMQVQERDADNRRDAGAAPGAPPAAFAPETRLPLAGRTVDKAQILNLAWRRSDWRFLTRHPWPQRSICFGDDALARSLALISGSLAVNRPAPEGSCDLAAIQKPTDSTLYMAMQALSPTGTLYAEFGVLDPGLRRWQGVSHRGRGPSRLARAREMLAAAGFVNVQFFYAYPTLETAHLWLPYDLPEAACRALALRWLSHSRLARQKLIEPLVNRLGPLASQLLATIVRLDLLPGLCAVACKDSDRPTPSNLANLRGDILDLGRDTFNSLRRTSGGSYSLLLQSNRLLPGNSPSQGSGAQGSGTQRSGAQVRSREVSSPPASGIMTGLVFTSSDSAPQWQLKMARLREDEAALRNEQQVLERLERVTSGDSSPVRLPRVLFMKDTQPGLVLCQTAVHGPTLSEALRADNFTLYAERLTNLQISLGRRTLATRPLALSQSKIESLVNGLAECLPAGVLWPAEIARLRQVFSTLVNLPIVCAHNNYAPWNVVIDGSRLGLLDWTDAEWSGLPMLDLVYMLAQMTFVLHGARGPERIRSAYRTMLDPLTRPGQVAQECIFRYTHSLGLPSGLIPALRLLTWTLQANFEERRLRREFQGQAPTSRFLRSEALALLRVELEEQVLPAWEEAEA